jgi:DNA-binding FadR family transcriptional regulator
VREALSYLEAMRLVERRAKSGIFMSGQRPSLEALAMISSLGVELRPEDLRQSVEMRKIFEVSAAKLAAERATEENFARLDAIMDETRTRIAASENIAREDVEFHLEIVRATQNTIFHRMVEIFYRMSEKRRIIYFSDAKRCRASLAQHTEILKALRERDAVRAESLMEAHLQGVDSYWRGLMAGGVA